MQFKYPEILWFLLLLLIPIIVHLFQLRRFKKTPFTNVAMLQQVISESRKSNSLKKWLLLFSRLLLLACLVLAFAQPFFAKENALKEKETVIYLDDSFSMQAKKDGISLLEKAIQDLVKSVPNSTKFSLFTNQKTFVQVDIKQIQNELISLKTQSKQLSFDNIIRKANTLFSKDERFLKNLILISDFQNRIGTIAPDTLNNTRINAVQLTSDSENNITIDSIFIDGETTGQLRLNIVASGLEEVQNTPLALYNADKLIAKTALGSGANRTSTTSLSLPANTAIQGRLEISDNALEFDNTFYFNVDEKPRIKVLAISGVDAEFLPRIFTEDEFEFENSPSNNLNYSSIAKQNLIVLNELETITASLQTALQSFLDEGGSLTIIPSSKIDINSYSSFLQGIMGVSLGEKITSQKEVSKIAYDHPLYAGVFERRVDNFDYPKISEQYTLTGNASNILSFSSGEPFLIGKRNIYLFSSPLNKESADFQESPLIVPSFYKMGTNSLKLAQPYFYIADKNEVDVPTVLVKDEIIKLRKEGLEIIPLQQSYPTKVGLSFEENPESAGIYSVTKDNDTVQNISFNHKRLESKLDYQELDAAQFASVSSKIPDLFEQLAKDNTIDAYWKWFVIFALIFALVEVLIQKFLA